MGFVGWGQMGKPMAMNMLKAGADLIVASSSPRSYDEFRRKGARDASVLADVAAADVIFLCLPNGDVVRDVLLCDDGIADRLRKGQTVVDTSTISYATTLEIAQALEQRGVDFIDAPVSGMESRAIDRTLTVMCGGGREVVDAVTPLLRTVGNNIF